MIIKFIFVSLFFISGMSYGQILKKINYSKSSIAIQDTNKLERKDFIKYPRYVIHVGVGFVNGVHIGGRLRLTEKTSIEASFGRSLIFDSQSKTNYYCVGLNVYGSSYSGFVLSLIGGYKQSFAESSGVISPNIGYFFIGKDRITLQIRGGIQIYTNRNYIQGGYGLEIITLDFSLGVSF